MWYRWPVRGRVRVGRQGGHDRPVPLDVGVVEHGDRDVGLVRPGRQRDRVQPGVRRVRAAVVGPGGRECGGPAEAVVDGDRPGRAAVPAVDGELARVARVLAGRRVRGVQHDDRLVVGDGGRRRPALRLDHVVRPAVLDPQLGELQVLGLAVVLGREHDWDRVLAVGERHARAGREREVPAGLGRAAVGRQPDSQRPRRPVPVHDEPGRVLVLLRRPPVGRADPDGRRDVAELHARRPAVRPVLVRRGDRDRVRGVRLAGVLVVERALGPGVRVRLAVATLHVPTADRVHPGVGVLVDAHRPLLAGLGRRVRVQPERRLDVLDRDVLRGLVRAGEELLLVEVPPVGGQGRVDRARLVAVPVDVRQVGQRAVDQFGRGPVAPVDQHLVRVVVVGHGDVDRQVEVADAVLPLPGRVAVEQRDPDGVVGGAQQPPALQRLD